MKVRLGGFVDPSERLRGHCRRVERLHDLLLLVLADRRLSLSPRGGSSGCENKLNFPYWQGIRGRAPPTTVAGSL
jgi:hypothetical protein